MNIAPNSIIEKGASIGDNTNVWYFAHVRENAKIGNNCNVGNYCYIDKDVVIGDDCRIANGVSIYQGTIIKDRVFIGNNVTFTNVRRPSASRKAQRFLYTVIEDDVTIDAGAHIVGGVKIGKGAKIAAGAVVISNIESFAFVAGNPAESPEVKRKKLFSLINKIFQGNNTQQIYGE